MPADANRTDASHEGPLEEILAEYLRAIESGKAPDPTQLIAAHPDLADELKSFFANRAALERLAEPMRGAAVEPTIGADSSSSTDQSLRVRYFGDYELLDELGRGGMGVVYKARQTTLNRLVALKMILAGQLAGPEDVLRFKQEAEAAANLDHPHIAPIYETGEHEGRHYFSMKLIEGRCLKDALPQLQSDLSAGVKLLSEVARAVHHAHQRGVLHRDLKPANVLLDEDQSPYVTDFGLAKRIAGGSDVSKSGAIIGTPSYMAPEQARAEKVLSTAVDVYSLGAILYELLTGEPPFRADSPLQTLLQVTHNEVRRPRTINPQVDRDLETIALKCLEKDPSRRYDSAAALADDLDRYLCNEPIVARRASSLERLVKWARRRPASAGLLGVSLASLAVVLGLLMTTNNRIRSERNLAVTARDDAVQAEADADAARRLAEQREQEARTAQKNETQALEQAEAHLEQAQARLARFHVFRGNQHLAQGDPAGALQWFVEALQAEAERPERGAVHRLRIALLLQDMPRLRLLLTHPSSLTATWSADGRELLTYHNNKVHRWDPQTGRLLQPPAEMQGNWSASGRFEGNGAYLLQESSRLIQPGGEKPWESSVQGWRTDNGATLGPPLVLGPHKDSPSVDLLPAGPRWLVLDGDDTKPQLRVVDPATGQDIFPPVPLPGRVCGQDMTQDGKHLLLTTVPKAADNEVVAAYLSAWDLTTGKCAREPFAVLAGAESGNRSNLARVFPFVRPGQPGQPKETEVLVAGHDEHLVATAQLWDLTDGKPRGPVVHVPAVHYGTPNTTGFRPDGRFSYFLEGDTLRLRDPESGGLEAQFEAAGPVRKVQYSRDNFHLALIGNEFAQVIPLQRTQDRWTVRDARLDQVHLHPDGQQLLCVHRDAELRLWTAPGERRTPALPRPGQKHESPETARKWQLSPDGSKMVVLYSSPVEPYWSLEMRDLAANRPVGPRIVMEDFVISWAVSPNKRQVATYRLSKEAGADKDFDWPEGDRIFQLWDMVSGTPALPPILVKGKFDRYPHRFFFTPDGRWLVAELYTGFRGHRMFAWDTATGQALTLPEPFDHIEFSPEGRYVLTSLLDLYAPDGKQTAAPQDKDVRVWDLAARRLVARLPLGEGNKIHTACFSEDGHRILISDYGHLSAWETVSGRRLHAPVPCSGSFLLAFSPDGTHYLGQEGNDAIHVFATATGARVATLPMPKGPQEGPREARFVAGGACVLTVTKKEAQVWDAATGEPVGPPLSHSDDSGEAPLQFSHDGNWAFTRTSDNAWARIWDLQPDARPLEDLEALAQLLSGHRLNDLGLREPIAPEEVGQLWQRLQPRYPDILGPPLKSFSHSNEAEPH